MFCCTVRQKRNRYWEIDALRGIAVILMIIYHICFALTFLGIVSLPIQTLPFLLFLYPIGTIFLLLVGISLTLKFSRTKRRDIPQKRFFDFFKQGTRIFSLGLLITVATFIYPHDGFILFGVLHCIGISIILGYFFVSRPMLSLFLGVSLVFFGVLLTGIRIDFPWLVWLGFRPVGFYTLDYFPLLPWFGVSLIGIFLGNWFYPMGKRKFTIKKRVSHPLLTAIIFLGQHSLPIYLIHQPIILGILFIFFIV